MSHLPPSPIIRGKRSTTTTYPGRMTAEFDDLLDQLHVETVRQLLARLRDPDSKPSDVANAVSYLRATKRPERAGEAVGSDELDAFVEKMRGRTERR